MTRLDVDGLLDDPATEILLCCGSGGVGKTTSAAALALRAAERGRRVCVLTIDPARRLAQALGLSALDNTPRPVVGAAIGNGSLDAMMLDMKRTFDEVVLTHATAETARQILDNPFYLALSSSFAGTQEYMAMEKLGQLHASSVREGRRWDLIVVDTPPSRSALDFLDAPERLSSLLDGRFLRLLLAPSRGPRRVFSAGLGLVTNTVAKVLGAQVLRDVQTFVAAFDTLFGGFRTRAEQTYASLQAGGTAFLVVAAPQPDAMREAMYFVDRLRSDDMPLAGLILNRVTESAVVLAPADATAGADRLTATVDSGGEGVARASVAGLLRVHADRARERAGEQQLCSEFSAAYPSVATAAVPTLPTDVHDLGGLRRIGELLAAG